MPLSPIDLLKVALERWEMELQVTDATNFPQIDYLISFIKKYKIAIEQLRIGEFKK